MPHLDEGTIHAWLDGALPPDEERAAAVHVAQCAECRAAVAEARGLVAAASRILTALDDVPAVGGRGAENELAAARARRTGVMQRWFGGARAAAVAVVVLGIGTYAVTHATNEPRREKSVAALADRAVAAEAGARAPALRDAAPMPDAPELARAAPMVAAAPPSASAPGSGALAKQGATADASVRAKGVAPPGPGEASGARLAAAPQDYRSETLDAARAARRTLAADVMAAERASLQTDTAGLAAFAGCYEMFVSATVVAPGEADPFAALPSRIALDTTVVRTDSTGAYHRVRILERVAGRDGAAIEATWYPLAEHDARIAMGRGLAIVFTPPGRVQRATLLAQGDELRGSIGQLIPAGEVPLGTQIAARRIGCER